MDKRLLFVYNPRSGKGMIKQHLMDIINVFTENGYLVLVHPTQHVEDARQTVQRLASQVDLVVCSGGDGTLDETVSGLLRSGVDRPLGYIPSGSTNDFASSLMIPKDMVKAARDIMHGQVYGCDVGRFNEDTFVYIAAFGLFTDVSYMTDQNLKNLLGHVAYLLEGVKRIFDIKSYHLHVEANGEVFEGDYIYGMITNSRSVGGFKNLTGTNIEMDDGLFEVTLIRMPKNPLELNEIVGSLISAIDDTDLVDTFKTDRIVIQGEEEIAWTLDGEYGGDSQKVVIENQKKSLHILLDSEKRANEFTI